MKASKLKVLDLFSGIGGFSLGLERTGGFETVAFCEIEDYPRRVLAKHWPGVPIYPDVRELTADTLRRDGIAVDVICGGFPCQDVSFAGKRAGLEGARSGLWREYARLIGELRPCFVLVENVPGLLNLGMGTVLGDLAALGYNATWGCIPASAVGAPHRRDRVWIVAHTKHNGSSRTAVTRSVCEGKEGRRVQQPQGLGAISYGANAAGERRGETGQLRCNEPAQWSGWVGEVVANADELSRHQGRARDAAEITRGRNADRSGVSSAVCNANVSGLALREGQSRDVGEECSPSVGADWWLIEPDVGRVAHGVPSRVDRLKGLGNAVVPQIPELIGRAILKSLEAAE